MNIAVVEHARPLRNSLLVLLCLWWLPNYLVNAEQVIEQIDTDTQQQLLQSGAMIQQDKLVEASVIIENVLAVQPDNAEAIYQKGAIAIRRNEIKEGIGLIERAIGLDQTIVRYRMALASMYEFIQQEDAAIEAYYTVLDLAAPDSIDYLEANKKIDYLQASSYAKKGDIAEARARFQVLAQEYPQDPLILYSLGIAQILSGQLDLAEKTLLAVLEINPDYTNATMSLASLYDKAGRLGQAIDMLDKLIMEEGDSLLGQQAKLKMNIIEGRLLLAEGNLQDALEIFITARRMNPRDSDVLFYLGRIYGQLGDWVNSAEVFEVLLELVPSHLGTRLYLMEAYGQMGETERALDQFEILQNQGAGTPIQEQAQELFIRLASSGFAGQQLINAWKKKEIGNLLKAIEESPDDIDLYRRLAQLYFELEMMVEAKEAVAQILHLNPADAHGYDQMAYLNELEGEFNAATELYAKSISLQDDPQQLIALQRSLRLVAAKAVYSDGNYKLARQLFAELLDDSPDDLEARFLTGSASLALEEYYEAIDIFQRILQHQPGNFGARLNLAQSYQMLKQEEEAIEEYQKILALNPPAEYQQQVENFMTALERSIRGFSGGLSYSMNYDSNTELSEKSDRDELRTDLATTLQYRYKSDNGLRWLISTEPMYSSYHRGQYDFLNANTSISATADTPAAMLKLGYSNRITRDLINTRRSSDNKSLFGVWTTHLNLPSIMSPLAADGVLSDISVSGSMSEIVSVQSPFYSADTTSLSVAVNQPVAERTSLGLSYSTIRNVNTELVGSDYAYRSHGFGVSINRGVKPGISIAANYMLTLYYYLYPDSVTKFTSFRENVQHSVSLAAYFQWTQRLRFFTNFNWTLNDSNLPVGNIVNAQDIIEGQQSSALGDYERYGLTAGMAVNF